MLLTMLPGSLLRIHALTTFVHPCTAGWQDWLRLENANNSKLTDIQVNEPLDRSILCSFRELSRDSEVSWMIFPAKEGVDID